MSTKQEMAKVRQEFSPDFFTPFQQRMNRMFENMFGPLYRPATGADTFTGWMPSCDIYETASELVLKAELPEVKKENVKINVEGNVLEITGERKFEEETTRENYHRVERNYGQFLRSFTLPTSVDPTKIVAEFKEGILRVTLPKHQGARPRQIEVKVK
jgi:HSP20 family protein